MSTSDYFEEFINPSKKIFKSDRFLGFILLAPAVFAIILVSLFPIMYGIWLSFQGGGFGVRGLSFVGVNNYSDLMTDDMFWFSLEKGIIYASYSVVLEVLAGLAIALVVNKSFKFVNVVRTIVLIPYLIPTIAIALMAKWLLNNQYGVVNYVLLLPGLIDQPVQFFSEGLAMHTVVWVSSWKFSIFVVLIVLARLQSIDPELYELSKINGANYFRRFFDVTLPNIKSTLLLAILLRSIWMFNKFDVIWLLTKGGPFDATTTIVIHAYDVAFQSLNFGGGAALSVIMFAVLIVVSVLYFYQFSPEEEVEG